MISDYAKRTAEEIRCEVQATKMLTTTWLPRSDLAELLAQKLDEAYRAGAAYQRALTILDAPPAARVP